MNIFATDIDHKIAALSLDNKRLVKMILESTQLLCTAVNEYGGISPYRTTHKNHPASIWARRNIENFTWLYNYNLELCKNYSLIYKRKHSCENIITDLYNLNKNKFINEPLTEFANCAAHAGKGLDFKNITPVTEAYKHYLIARWNTDKRTPQWGLGMPTWVKEIDNKYYLC